MFDAETKRCHQPDVFIDVMKQRKIEGIDLTGDNLKLKLWYKKSVKESHANILLLHGGSYSTLAVFEPSELFKNQYSLFNGFSQRGINVFGLDLNGYGFSEFLQSPHDINEYIKEIDIAIEFIKRYFIDLPIWILGWSFGAQLAARYSMNSIKSISGLIFYGGFWGGGIGGKPALFRENFCPPPESRRANRFEHVTGDFKTAGTFDPAYMSSFAEWALKIDPSSPTVHLHEIVKVAPIHEPEKINIPTLIVHGENDLFARQEDLMEYYLRLCTTNKNYVIFRNGDHNLHQGYQCIQWLEAVARFINNDRTNTPGTVPQFI